MRSVQARALSAGIIWALGAGLLAHLALVQLALTGDYATPDLASAAVNIVVALGAVVAGLAISGARSGRTGMVISGAAFVVATLVTPLVFGRLGQGAIPVAVSAFAIAAVLTTRGGLVANVQENLASVSTRLAISPNAVLSLVCVAVASIALADRAVRSALALNVRWDAFYYHLPFAAIWGGLSIPYDMNNEVRPLFDGYPPLPEMAQGLLWRLSGSVNATGVVNMIAFGLFLIYCHKVLRAPFWLVSLISLTAPLVLIHTAVSYVDLFGNAFLAIGVCSCLSLYLFPERRPRLVLLCGLAGLAAAAWSKYLLVPVVGIMFILFAVLAVWARLGPGFNRRQAAVTILVFSAIASAPYVKNLAVYGNPFWPIRVPIADTLFPYLQDTAYFDTQRPTSLSDAPQAEVFVQSLFEINVPTSYPNRLRWIEDQGSTPTPVGFRMGGFWGTSVIVFLLVSFVMLVVLRRRTGVIASVVGIGLICFVAVLPGSNNLRYNMFIPLTWAATIGMLYPELRVRFPRAGFGLLAIVLVLFGQMVAANLPFYQIHTFNYRDAALAWRAAEWWPRLQQGTVYCVVDMSPIGMMMTGPTMHEFTIVDRTRVSLCPVGATVVTVEGVQGPYRP